MHWMVLFSHCTVCFPSTLESHSAVLAVCIPAPAFCTKLTVQTNLKGLFKAASLLRHPSCEARDGEENRVRECRWRGRSREEFARRDLGLGLTTTLDVHWFTFVCMNALSPTTFLISCSMRRRWGRTVSRSVARGTLGTLGRLHVVAVLGDGDGGLVGATRTSLMSVSISSTVTSWSSERPEMRPSSSGTAATIVAGALDSCEPYLGRAPHHFAWVQV